MQSQQQRMTALIDRLAPAEGATLSALDGVKFMRVHRPVPRTPVLYEPCIVIVCSGRKRGHLGGQSYDYDAQQFLVLSVPLPFEGETVMASEAEPMLAVSIRIDLQMAAELMLAVEQSGTAIAAEPKGIISSPIDAKLCDAVLRLLEALTCPMETQLLAPGAMREILYRVLTSVQGGSLRAALAHQSHFGKIGKALRRIHANLSSQIDVATLAGEAGMSVAAFHANFKAVTQTSPIQYLKCTRLHKARLLMVQDGLSAASASARVGYESSSQFSREFKRFFGRTPADEAREMRTLLSQMPAERAAPYITVQ